jgi:hypothetical protein
MFYLLQESFHLSGDTLYVVGETQLYPIVVTLLEVLDFLMGYESYLRKRGISVLSRRYKPTGKHRHLLR